MTSQIRKWGNSLAVRIPSALAEQCELNEGSPVELVVKGRELIIQKPKYSLEVLLGDRSAQNPYGEISTGPARGKEEW